MKLTEEQIQELRDLWSRAPYYHGADVQAVIDTYHVMLAASKTHRFVEAPEGYEFEGDLICKYEEVHGKGSITRLGFNVRRTPKPCPPPVLEPVTVTWDRVYKAQLPKIPTGWEACLGYPEELSKQGFTHGFALDATQFDAKPIDHLSQSEPRICLRKWEGK